MDTYCTRCARAVYVAKGEPMSCPVCSSTLIADVAPTEEAV